MTFYNDIKELYVTAARLMAAASRARIDLLATASAQMINQPQRIVRGYEDLSASLGICLPAGERCVVSFLSPRSEGMRLQADDAVWMTLEGWLPADAATAASCFVEIECESDLPLVADVFLREIDEDFSAVDSTPVEWHLSANGLSVLEVPLSGAPTGRRKIVVHLRRPPAVVVLKCLTLTPV